jgi:hypothetical protein
MGVSQLLQLLLGPSQYGLRLGSHREHWEVEGLISFQTLMQYKQGQLVVISLRIIFYVVKGGVALQDFLQHRSINQLC